MTRSPWTPAGLVLLLAATVWVLLVTPATARLGRGYQAEFAFDSQARMRETASEPWERIRLVGRRIDTVLVAADTRLIMQSDVVWSLSDGRLLYDNPGVYAIDHDSRANIPGLGSTSRTGQFMFPPGVEPMDHILWDSQFAGPRLARFRGRGERAGLPAYRFDFHFRGLDETTAYGHLPDVPGRYQAHTDGDGEIWVEPRTGLVLDHVERGRSYFARPDGGEAAAFLEWQARFSAVTRAAQARRVVEARRGMLVAGVIIPGALAMAGLMLLLIGIIRQRRLVA